MKLNIFIQIFSFLKLKLFFILKFLEPEQIIQFCGIFLLCRHLQLTFPTETLMAECEKILNENSLDVSISSLVGADGKTGKFLYYSEGKRGNLHFLFCSELEMVIYWRKVISWHDLKGVLVTLCHLSLLLSVGRITYSIITDMLLFQCCLLIMLGHHLSLNQH